MEKVRISIAGIMLIVCSLQDIKKMNIHWGLPIAAILLGIITGLASDGAWDGVSTLLAGVMPGVTMLLASVITQGEIGAGDGWVLLALGSLTDWKNAVFSLTLGLVLCLPVSLYWCMVRKEKKKEIPFIPFLSGGFLCQILLGM